MQVAPFGLREMFAACLTDLIVFFYLLLFTQLYLLQAIPFSPYKMLTARVANFVALLNSKDDYKGRCIINCSTELLLDVGSPDG